MKSRWGRITQQVYTSEQNSLSAEWVRVIISHTWNIPRLYPPRHFPITAPISSCLDGSRTFLTAFLHLPLPPVNYCPHRRQKDLLQNPNMTLSRTAAWSALKASSCFQAKVWPGVIWPYSCFHPHLSDLSPSLQRYWALLSSWNALNSSQFRTVETKPFYRSGAHGPFSPPTRHPTHQSGHKFSVTALSRSSVILQPQVVPHCPFASRLLLFPHITHLSLLHAPRKQAWAVYCFLTCTHISKYLLHKYFWKNSWAWRSEDPAEH